MVHRFNEITIIFITPSDRTGWVYKWLLETRISLDHWMEQKVHRKQDIHA